MGLARAAALEGVKQNLRVNATRRRRRLYGTVLGE
jgi:hypothetical protein